MKSAPRCRAKRRDGTPCKAPALRGATRCVKHGGRVEVPAHPHNLRRFFSGAIARVAVAQTESPRVCRRPST
ncbi:HGGxSTG domain-containing protein [Roseovarius sp.]|uniref:HGGxSTG domain-containing protein n=1 Tax=Roseovarius sp. TaxID=1486281 RepID=UPI003A9721A9